MRQRRVWRAVCRAVCRAEASSRCGAAWRAAGVLTSSWLLGCGSSNAPAGSGGASGDGGFPAPSLSGSGGAGFDFGDVGGPPPQPDCSGLACPDPACPAGGHTTISGTVFAPSGSLPLYNVMVYVPSAPLAPLSEGVTCSCEVSGEPVAAAVTDTEGRFVLPNVPAGREVPLVIQVGKWRRQFSIPNVAACEETAVPAQTLRLPARQAEGDMPRIALSTGNADAMECLVRKLGIDPLEFTNPEGTGRINYFAGRDGTDHYVDGMNGGAAFPDAKDLWSTVSSLSRYDVVLLSCEGQSNYDDNKPSAAYRAMFDYANLGGRIFASHWHQQWLQRGPSPFPEVASFVDEDDIGEIEADVVTTFPKGKALAEWLVNVDATSTLGKIELTGTQHTLTRENPAFAQRWIATDSPETVQYLSANTPFAAPADQQCGRIVLSDIHVTGSATEGRDVSNGGLAFPDGCTTTDLSPQEKVLAYMLFDISACIVPDDQPPQPPTIIVR